MSGIAEALQLLWTAADRKARWHFAAAIVLVTAGGLLAALAPLALKGLVDAVAQGSDGDRRFPSHSALLLGGGYLLALGCGRALGEFQPLFAGTAEQRLLSRLTQRFFGHLLALPLQFHLGRRPGELVHNIHMATTGAKLLTAHLVNSLLPVLVEMATVSAVLIHLDQPALVATFAATALAYLFLFGCGSVRVSRRAHQVSDASVSVNALLTDTLLNCEAVKCFVAEPASRIMLMGASNALEARWQELYRVRSGLGLAVTVTFTVSIATSLYLAAQGVAQGTLTIGGFVLANVYMLQIIRPWKSSAPLRADMSQAIGFIRPVLDVLTVPTEAVATQSAPTSEDLPGEAAAALLPARKTHVGHTKSRSIHFEQVWFGYDTQRPVLKALDLDIAAGRTLAIVGASGSGKSSLIRLLLRLYEPQSGRILVDRSPLAAWPSSDLRSLIGLVPQDTVLFNDTLANNIGLGKPGAHRSEIEMAARRAQLHDFIDALPQGYDTLVGERGLKLSGGERQRIAIARVLLKSPHIFVFDEATSMLDSRTEAAILRDLQAVSDGCTTITIAHRLSTVCHADVIVVLDHGEITGTRIPCRAARKRRRIRGPVAQADEWFAGLLIRRSLVHAKAPHEVGILMLTNRLIGYRIAHSDEHSLISSTLHE